MSDRSVKVCIVILWVVIFGLLGRRGLLLGMRASRSSLVNRLCKSSGYDAGGRVHGDWYCILGEDAGRQLFALGELIEEASD